MNIYDLAYLTFSPFIAPVIAWKMFKHNKYKKSIPGMFYFREHQDEVIPDSQTIWIHAVSVGEISGAKALIPHLRKLFPNYPIILTVTTETGFSIAKQLEGKDIDFVRFFPFDLSLNVRRFITLYQPAMYIGLETELWPNLFIELQNAGTEIFILNGRISRSAMKKYRMAACLFSKILRPVKAFGMQTSVDAQNMSTLIGRSDNIIVTGNIKLDIAPTQYLKQELTDFRHTCNIKDKSLIVTWGSTHEGEEEIAIRVLLDSDCFENEESIAIIVPRHPERFQTVYKLLVESGVTVVRYSDQSITLGKLKRKAVLIDAMGLLNKVYAMSDIGIVAGSFVDNIGGHNILEPAVYKIPVLYGKNMWGQPDMLRILDGFGGIMCSNEKIGDTITDLLNDSTRRRDVGEKVFAAVDNNRGAVVKSIKIIQNHMQCR